MTYRNVLLLICILMFNSSTWAQPERYVAGTHYTKLSDPVRTSSGSKIEVVELFWYGCPHCFRLEPLLVNWDQNKPEDVVLVRVPAMFDDLTKIHAKIFFTAQNLRILDRTHDTTYRYLSMERKRLQSNEQIAQFFAEFGVEEEEFKAAFDSFSVKTKLKQADTSTKAYQANMTPSLIVSGKYLATTGAAVTTQKELLKVVNFLLEKERRERNNPGT